jgi:D-ribose pyranase
MRHEATGRHSPIPGHHTLNRGHDMKKSGILHSDLARIVASMGHGDRLVVCDSGYPIPHNRPVADVVLTAGIPGIIDTLKAILAELHIEGAVMAEEVKQVSTQMHREILGVVGTVPLTTIPHEKFKDLCRTEPNTSFVRTGEATKYSNIMLIAGVVF